MAYECFNACYLIEAYGVGMKQKVIITQLFVEFASDVKRVMWEISDKIELATFHYNHDLDRK